MIFGNTDLDLDLAVFIGILMLLYPCLMVDRISHTHTHTHTQS